MIIADLFHKHCTYTSAATRTAKPQTACFSCCVLTKTSAQLYLSEASAHFHSMHLMSSTTWSREWMPTGPSGVEIQISSALILDESLRSQHLCHRCASSHDDDTGPHPAHGIPGGRLVPREDIVLASGWKGEPGNVDSPRASR